LDFRAAILGVVCDHAWLRCLMPWRIAFSSTTRPALDRLANNDADVGHAATDA
jgi:hypothetical protein